MYVLQHTLLRFELGVLLPVDVSEAPLAGNDDLLTTREFVTSAAESFPDNGRVGILRADGKDDLADVNTGGSAVWLAPCTTHTGLQTVTIARLSKRCLKSRIPAAYRSAPAHDNILLIRRTWKGWTRTLRWKASLPAVLVMYLLQQIRAASRASLESCSYSSETRWTQ